MSYCAAWKGILHPSSTGAGELNKGTAPPVKRVTAPFRALGRPCGGGHKTILWFSTQKKDEFRVLWRRDCVVRLCVTV